MVYDQIRMFKALCNEIGEAGAKTLFQVVEATVENKTEKMKIHLASKEDVTALKQEITSVRESISSLRTELTKAIYVTTLGQVLVIVGSIIVLAKVLK